MPTVRAGRLRHRVRVESPTEARSASGEVTRTWATDEHRWCDIRPMSGREYIAADHTVGQITHEIRMRYFAGLSVRQRIVEVVSGRTFEIVAALNGDERDRMTTVMAREAVT